MTDVVTLVKCKSCKIRKNVNKIVIDNTCTECYLDSSTSICKEERSLDMKRNCVDCGEEFTTRFIISCKGKCEKCYHKSDNVCRKCTYCKNWFCAPSKTNICTQCYNSFRTVSP